MGTMNPKALPMQNKQFIDAWIAKYGPYKEPNNEYVDGDGALDEDDGKEEGNPGWTMPENEYYSAWRPDRMYFSFNYDYNRQYNHANGIEEECKKGGWMLKNIVRIGMEKMENEEDNMKESEFTILTPSDHYGLLAEFELVGIEMQELK